MNKEYQKGYIALTSFLIISGVVLLVAVTSNLLGISESDMSVKSSNADKAFYLANLCAEEALMSLKEDDSYTGNISINEGEGFCQILPVEGIGNNNRVVKTFGTVYNQVRRVKIEITQINPQMIINSWEEVTNF